MVDVSGAVTSAMHCFMLCGKREGVARDRKRAPKENHHLIHHPNHSGKKEENIRSRHHPIRTSDIISIRAVACLRFR